MCNPLLSSVRSCVCRAVHRDRAARAARASVRRFPAGGLPPGRSCGVRSGPRARAACVRARARQAGTGRLAVAAQGRSPIFGGAFRMTMWHLARGESAQTGGRSKAPVGLRRRRLRRCRNCRRRSETDRFRVGEIRLDRRNDDAPRSRGARCRAGELPTRRSRVRARGCDPPFPPNHDPVDCVTLAMPANLLRLHSKGECRVVQAQTLSKSARLDRKAETRAGSARPQAGSGARMRGVGLT